MKTAQETADCGQGLAPMRHQVLLWIATGILGSILCLYELSGALIDGEYVPADQDSFYHAARILLSIDHPTNMYQFDARIHSPEGSWITWPWAYDMAMAGIGHLYVSLTGSNQPLALLAYIAPAWFLVNSGLMLAITRQLRLSFPYQVIAMLFHSLLPLNRGLHRVGMLDHHFVEYTFVLATLYFGLRFFRSETHASSPYLLGIILGMAPAFHNGLFILQFPVIASIGLLWLRGDMVSSNKVMALGFSLVGATTLFLLPSQPFQLGMFSFYLHSWFHLYVACITAAFCLLLCATPYSPRQLAIVLLLAAVSAIPLAPEIQLGSNWVTGQLRELGSISEVVSPWIAMASGRALWIVETYTGLIILLPLTLCWVLWQLRMRLEASQVYFLIMLAFGIVLMSNQMRLQYFGSFAMFLPACVIANRYTFTGRSRTAFALTAACFAAALVPGYRDFGAHHTALASDLQYAYSRGLFKVLASACASRPGLVLAENNDGHLITYSSACSVISNNFIMTPQHERKIQETRQLLAMPYADALARRPDIRYILVRRADDVLYTRKSNCGARCMENTGMRAELMFDLVRPPIGLRLLAESRISVEGKAVPFARLFEVVAH